MRCENIPKTVSERKYFILNTRAVSANHLHKNIDAFRLKVKREVLFFLPLF